MKKMIVLVLLMGLISPAFASEVMPPRVIVEWLIKAVQEGSTEVVGWYLKFDKEKHQDLTPLSRDEQLHLLKDIPLDKLVFDKDKYAIDQGMRFVVRLVAPKKLDFEIKYVQLEGEKGPPWKYEILAVRETASSSAPGSATPALLPLETEPPR